MTVNSTGRSVVSFDPDGSFFEKMEELGMPLENKKNITILDLTRKSYTHDFDYITGEPIDYITGEPITNSKKKNTIQQTKENSFYKMLGCIATITCIALGAYAYNAGHSQVKERVLNITTQLMNGTATFPRKDLKNVNLGDIPLVNITEIIACHALNDCKQ